MHAHPPSSRPVRAQQQASACTRRPSCHRLGAVMPGALPASCAEPRRRCRRPAASGCMARGASPSHRRATNNAAPSHNSRKVGMSRQHQGRAGVRRLHHRKPERFVAAGDAKIAARAHARPAGVIGRQFSRSVRCAMRCAIRAVDRAGHADRPARRCGRCIQAARSCPRPTSVRR